MGYHVGGVGRSTPVGERTITLYGAATKSRVNGLAATVCTNVLPAILLVTMIAVVILVAFMATISFPARAENTDISIRRESQRAIFTNDEIVDGFLKIAFGAELHVG